MTFNKFIDKLNPEAVNEWWEEIPSEAPTDAEDSNWKYKLSKNGKSLPFKWSMRHLAETINLDLNSFSSNLENRTKFCEAFNFEIKEELIFDNTEKAKLKNFYYKEVSKSVIFQNWIDYAHSLVTEAEIDPYKIRMAIRNSPQEAMVIIGMPNILTYKEVEGKSIVGFILPDEKADEFTSKMKIYKKFPFENGNSLYRFEIQSWDEIHEAIKSHNSKLVAELYQSIKDTKRANWNQEASTTNSALKYLIFNGSRINNFIDKDKIVSHKVEFFTEEEFTLLNRSENQKYDKNDPESKETYQKLKGTYKKVDYWANAVLPAFPKGVKGIRKQPVNRAQNFDGYLWARLYPTKKDADEKYLAITLGTDSDFHFNIKIDVYQNSTEQGKIYNNYRGDFFNSEIVRRHHFSEIKDWDHLIEVTLKEINFLIPEYYKLKSEIDPKYTIPNNEKNEAKNQPLNKILYGPPGTGKTFKLQNAYFDNFTVRESSLSRTQFLENLVADLTWWQVIAIVLLDIKKSKVNDIHSHELLVIKEKLSNSKRVRPTIWGNLQHYTDPECENVNVADRSNNPLFYKDKDSFWEVKTDLLEQFYPEAFSILEEIKNYSPDPDKLIKNYEFITFHQSFSYEDFIEGIKPKLEDQENEISYEIQDGIFKKLCLKADADRDNNYAIFIDEINRGNVSAIFGELITLIEQDKRLGEENELRAKLPYSKKELGVPPNLHIFGTMNTADRSVEALDTALRRRFAFEEVMPIPELLDNIEFDKFNLSQVLKVVNERIEALLDRDHTIGHSYFISIQTGDTAALKYAFENKVIPLLQEYFYHDYEKIALILGEGFVEHREAKVRFANFKKIDQPELDSSYELKTIEDIEEAILILLNKLDEEGD